MSLRFAGLFTVCAGSILLSSCGASDKNANAPKAPPPVPVTVYALEKGTAVYYDQYPATLVPLNEVQLRPQVTGYITGIFFKDGQHVSKGQKLYSIDQQQYAASYNQAVANLNVAQANLGKAQQDADRYAELLKKDAIARQTAEHAQADLQASKMQLEAAKANVASVQTNVRYSTIYAPFDGTIGISQVKIGSPVSPGQTVLNTVSTVSPMAADISVDQHEIPRFIGLEQSAKPKDSVFTLAFSDNVVYPQIGTISFLDRAVDPQTGTIKVRLIFANAKDALKAGMTCNVRVKNNSSDSTFLLAPYKAVVEQLGENFIFVASNNKALQRKVMLGAKINDKVIVKSGLNVGDSIIIDGVQKLRDSTAIASGAPHK
ncbi:MAG: efflux RND transporter periplasmic adaptor subunit [Chitinophagaceae bacterium]